ncbi:hypothetical protein [Roseomonas xinghualingensis]|uniref:hypothetical protein n=1 Tax=Roseomonas xinghualingensis TaxID=2986475 RepID=UPI0021F21142|nr:hypothetical protein [Roseomonas sp. SXEYE001]MCV4210114.1 hypothetical protein [Roseomonas sp. SXEYE001]
MPEEQSPLPLQLLHETLSTFLADNPKSPLAEINSPKECFAIQTPWSDNSMVIEVDGENGALHEALNAVILPARYAAIWHKDKREFEIIWTAFKVPSGISDVAGRQFTFRYDNIAYKCEFGPSSERLLVIASSVMPIGPSTTQYRNLFSFSTYLTGKENENASPSTPFGEPLSFWIRDIPWDWDDDRMLDLATHLNFHMYYYDTRTPQILMFNMGQEAVIKPQSRYREEKFPAIINARTIDAHAYYFWDASLSGDVSRRFIYNYQIIEYGTFYFTDESVKRSMRRILSAPSASSNVENTMRLLMDAFGTSKMQEAQKMENLLRNIVDPAVIWREIEQNINYFTAPIQFDGGYELAALIKPNWKVDDFSHQWLPTFPNTIRGIRNALSHGREQRQVQVIAPTKKNAQYLLPWIAPLSVIARDVILYSDLG